MQAIIKPGFLQGIITVPPSKSIMQRVCAAALLHKGKTIIHRPGVSKDDEAALHIIQQLGAYIIERSTDKIIIESSGLSNDSKIINCEESGLSARMFTPIAALSENEIRIEGTGNLLKRPMFFFKEVLPQLNVTLREFDGFVPFIVRGALQPKNITIDGSISSQFLTGLLFAFSETANEPVEIIVKDLKSRPYIDLTIRILQLFGRHVTHDNYSVFKIEPSKFFNKEDIEIDIEGDWSSAAYWLVAGAISGKITVDELNQDSLQADKKIIEILQQCNGNLKIVQDKFIAEHSSMKSFETDLADAPDLFPIASILASCCEGKSILKGLHRLKHKESDREKSIADMLEQFGVQFFIEGDTMIIEGRKKLNAAIINGNNDHRIVMAAAIGASVANGATTITDIEAVSKSYPDFFKHLRSLDVQYEFKN